MTMRMAIRTVLVALAVGVSGVGGAHAQDVTLRLHQFLPAQSVVPRDILDVWADRVEDASDGRIEIVRYPSMSLGGAPPELIDQAADGIADIIWTVVGYTPGRFPTTEVFELPFMVTDPRAASCAYWKLFETDMQDEFSGVRVLGTWVHGPGAIHAAEPVAVPQDLEGLKIRGGSRLVNQLLDRAGATPVGMPVPAVPEALSKGVIDGATVPWEVTTALKVPELVEFHTEFKGAALYTLTFVMAMNKDAYAGLPEDLKQVIDENSGLEFSIFAADVQQAADAPARAVAVDLGNEIVTIDAQTAQSEWLPLVQPIYDDWASEIDGGADLIQRARALMDGECRDVTAAY